MLSKIYSAGLRGIDGFEVTVECSGWDRIPRFELVGLPDAAVKEAKERVRSACENSGIFFPSLDLMVNLAPANRRKEGSAFDLAILVSILHCAGIIPYKTDLSDKCFVGELSLSGEVRPTDGILCLALAAKEAGRKELYVPVSGACEASVVEGLNVYGVSNMRQLIAHLRGESKIEPTVFEPLSFSAYHGKDEADFADVRGQFRAKRALEIAAAGGHNILMIGPPGSGKSMLAKRLPSILPDLTFDESVELTKIHSVSGIASGRLVTTRPFRSPHHTVSTAGLVGGGSDPKPGEISLAHHGVLFLDELPEFSKQLTEALRQPIEDGAVTVTRATAQVRYPSKFMLVCAMNPCRCGFYGHPTKSCTCRSDDVKKYLAKVSGPMLDRIDIQIELPSVSFDEMTGDNHSAERSEIIRERVNRARTIAQKRYTEGGEQGILSNAHLTSAGIRKYCKLDAAGEALLRQAFDNLGMSARGYDRILRVARTIADLAGFETIGASHIAEAIQLRALDKKYWST